jgi:hypothetical protein
MADASYQPKVYRRQGGDELVVAAGGLITIEDGGGITQAAEVVVTTKALTATESGKTLFLDLAGAFVTTLPAPAAGLQYEFILKTAVTSTMTIVTASSANVILGQVYTLDVNSATDPDLEATAGADTISFVANKAIAGDRVVLRCDGTNWYAYGFCSVFDAITLTTAS